MATAKPWLWLVICTRPVRQVLDRLVHPAVPEAELVGAQAERPAQDLAAQADAEHRRRRGPARRGSRPPRSQAAAGSPGPLEKNTPSGRAARISSAVTGRREHGDLAAAPGHGPRRGGLDAQVHGRDPVADRRAVRRGHRVGGGRGHLPGQVGAGHLRAGQDPLAERGRVGPVPVAIPARIAPRSRRCRVSARVPVIAMPVMPWARSSSSRLRCDRQLEASRAGSRTT